MSSTSCKIVVSGRVDDKNFQAARIIAEELAELHDNVTCQVVAMFGTEWSEYVKEKAQELGVRHKVSPLVYYNKKHYIGSTEQLLEWTEKVYDFKRNVNGVVAQNVARKEFRAFLERTGHSFCYLDVAVAEEDQPHPVTERVVVELYDDICPKTCDNFTMLCTEAKKGLTYKGTSFHRAVQGGWVQGGDVVDSSGANSESAFDTPTFPDETYAVKHSKAGIISMASQGKSNSNGSQFFITLAPMNWLDCKRVAFGKVAYGMRAINLIQAMPLKNERPIGLCQIYDCGIFTGETSLLPSKFKPSQQTQESKTE